IGDRTEPPGQHAHPAGRQVGDDRCGQPDECKLTKRHTRALIGQREQSVGHVAHHWGNRTGRGLRAYGSRVNRKTGLVVFTRERLYALLPTIPRLKVPVALSYSGLQFDLEINRVDHRFRGHLSLKYKTSLPDDVLAALRSRSLAFGVTPDYMFHMLG